MSGVWGFRRGGIDVVPATDLLSRRGVHLTHLTDGRVLAGRP